MEKTLNNRTKIRKILYTVFLIIVLAVLACISTVKATSLSRQLNITNQRALTELDGYISAISTDLEKGIYANTPTMLNTMASELMRNANGAKSSVSALPLSDAHLDNTYRFLSQVGAFVSTLNSKVASGNSISESEREQLYSLLDISRSLSDEISSILEGVQNGSLTFEATANTLSSSDEQLQSLASSMNDAEQTLTEYPSLIYDGPFSDHILNMEPKLLEGKDEISKDEALAKAAEFTGTKAENIAFEGESASTIPSYLFSYESAGIAISKQGGYVVYLLGSSYAGEAKINESQAIENAAAFLSSKGYENMKDSYYSVNDGVCTINFAYMLDGTICYPDLIKVSISLETGNVLSFDARGYIMNHTQRTLETPKITQEQAAKSVSPLLRIISVESAVIPTESKGEKQTYEFHCKAQDDSELLVYIDKQTGFEDDILLLLYSDGGILTK